MTKQKHLVAIVIIVILIALLLVFLSRKKRDRSDDATDETVEGPKPPSFGPPSEIKLTVEGSTINVKWNQVETASGYKVYYSNQSDFKKDDARTIEGIDKGEFVINKVPNGKYYFRVTSKKDDVESEMSELHTIEIDACPLPDPPRDVKSEIISIGDKLKVSISWRPSVEADGYVIHLRHTSPTEASFMDIKVAGVDSSSHILENLDPSVKWFASVSCESAHCGPGKPSEIVGLN